MANETRYGIQPGSSRFNSESNNKIIDVVCGSDFQPVVADLDNDGFDNRVDCDDSNPNINPGMNEIPYNSIDDDCNPSTLDDDLDEDGYNIILDCDFGTIKNPRILSQKIKQIVGVSESGIFLRKPDVIYRAKTGGKFDIL